MDWSKAKSILIVIFLALNIVLLFTNFDTLSSWDGTPKEIITDTAKIMESRGIKLKCEIPKHIAQAMLNYEKTQYDKAGVVYKLLDLKIQENDIKDDNEIINRDKKLIFEDNGFTYFDNNSKKTESISKFPDAEKILNKFLKKLDLPISEYILDKHIKNSDDGFEMQYIHKYKNYYIFDDYIKAEVSKMGITKLEYRYRNVRNVEENSGQKVFEAYQVLIEANDIKDTSINSINLGFKKDISDEDTKSSFDVLTWRITLGNGTEKYYNALSGKVIN